MADLVLYLVAFLAMFAMDFVFARYTRAVLDRKPDWAGIWAASVVVFQAAGVVAYVNKPGAIACAAAGAFAGTWLAVRRD